VLRCVFLAAVCASGCVYVDADVAKITQTLGPATFTASPTAGVTLMETQKVQVDSSTSLATLFTEADITEMKIVGASGVSTMDFIQSITVTAIGDALIPNIVFATYTKDMGVNSDGTLTAKLATGFDQTPYILTERPFSLEVVAIAPTVAWELNMEVTMHASSSKSFSP
jgi:hypothetical protein